MGVLRIHLGLFFVAALCSSSSCLRVADAEATYDFEALKLDACRRACDTMDACSPGQFDGMEPDNCFERCMTLLPRLHEENQCGSREMLYLQCLGDLTCEGYVEFEEGNNSMPRDYNAPCVTELQLSCSDDQPFDLDEATTSSP